MLFCHRWLLLCFKREFPEAEALRIWEACWAHYQVSRAGATPECSYLPSCWEGRVMGSPQASSPVWDVSSFVLHPLTTPQSLTLIASIFQARAAGFRPHLPCN